MHLVIVRLITEISSLMASRQCIVDFRLLPTHRTFFVIRMIFQYSSEINLSAANWWDICLFYLVAELPFTCALASKIEHILNVLRSSRLIQLPSHPFQDLVSGYVFFIHDTCLTANPWKRKRSFCKLLGFNFRFWLKKSSFSLVLTSESEIGGLELPNWLDLQVRHYSKQPNKYRRKMNCSSVRAHFGSPPNFGMS